MRVREWRGEDKRGEVERMKEKSKSGEGKSFIEGRLYEVEEEKG